MLEKSRYQASFGWLLPPGMSSGELFRHRPGSGNPGGIQSQGPGKVGWKRPCLGVFCGEEHRFPAAEQEQDRVFCSPVGGLGKDISFRSP